MVWLVPLSGESFLTSPWGGILAISYEMYVHPLGPRGGQA